MPAISHFKLHGLRHFTLCSNSTLYTPKELVSVFRFVTDIIQDVYVNDFERFYKLYQQQEPGTFGHMVVCMQEVPGIVPTVAYRVFFEDGDIEYMEGTRGYLLEAPIDAVVRDIRNVHNHLGRWCVAENGPTCTVVLPDMACDYPSAVEGLYEARRLYEDGLLFQEHYMRPARKLAHFLATSVIF